MIRMNAFKLQSVNIDLFLDLFIFIQEKACSQMYVDPNSGKSLTAKFFKVWKRAPSKSNKSKTEKTLAEKLTLTSPSGHNQLLG